MKAPLAAALILCCSFVGAANGTSLQSQETTNATSAADSGKRTSRAKPTNLKVLPKDISGDDIDELMHRYQQYLGVSCGYCHEENPRTKEFDYASDENPMKQTARVMIAMTSDINSRYLSQLGDSRYAEPFVCGNCHRGQVRPPAFELKP